MIALGAAGPALAQNIVQGGASPVATGRVGAWIYNGIQGNGEGAAGCALSGTPCNVINSLGITGAGTTLCQYDAFTDAPGGYHQLCLAANALGGGLISYNAYGGASPLGLSFQINGTTYGFPGPGNGNVIGPNSAANLDVPLFNTNTLLLDSGFPFSLGPAFKHVVVNAPSTASGLDAAPAFRAAMQSNAYITVPPGDYTFCSVQNTIPYADLGPPAVWVLQISNFVLDLRGVTLRTCNTITTGNTGIDHFLFDQDTNYLVLGGTLVGNQTGKNSGGDTVGIASFNDVNFTYSGQIFSGDWSSLSGSAYDGDWLVNGIWTGAVMPNVSKCFDMAFMQHAVFENFYGTGALSSHEGVFCFGNQFDHPSITYNKTGYTINDTTNVTVQGGYGTGFDSGWTVSSGTDYTFTGNHWVGNVGNVGNSQPGVGGLVNYYPSGPSSSVGHPPGNIWVVGDHYVGNGNSTYGLGGVYIESAAVTPPDVISGVHISALLNGNATTGAEATSTSHLSDVTIDSNYEGTGTQTTSLGSSVSAITAPTCTVLAGAPVSLTTATSANICSISLPAGVWNVSGNAGITSGSGTTVTIFAAAISTTSATLPASAGVPGYILETPPSTADQAIDLAVGTVRLNLATTTTAYLVVSSTFSGGTNSGVGSLVATRGS